MRQYVDDERGLTLVETLIAVVIITILGALIFVNVISYQRSMNHLERDAVAKEILIAAQNHLTMADSEGLLSNLDSSEMGTPSTWSGDAGKGIYYFIYPTDSLDNGDALELMLPYGSIDETVRQGGSYVIRYQLPTAQVLDVFYASNSPGDRFSHEFDPSEYASLEGVRDTRDAAGKVIDNKSEERATYGEGAIIGWCDAGTVTTSAVGVKVNAPKVTIKNAERLTVEVDNSANVSGSTANGELKLVVKGKTSKAIKEIVLLDDSYTRVLNPGFDDGDTTSKSTFHLVLDDITESGKHFAELFSTAGTGTFIPGEDLSIEAVAFDSKKLNNIARSGAKTANSLFDSVSSGVARISNMRHLENLDPNISAVDHSNLSLSNAEQTKNVAWTDSSWSSPVSLDALKGFRERVIYDKTSVGIGADSYTPEQYESEITAHAGDVKVFSVSGGVATSAGSYHPVDAPYLMQYDGKNHSVTGVKIEVSEDAGLFKQLSNGCAVKDLELKSFSVSSSGGNAGALAGTAENVNVSGVLVYNNRTDAPSVEIHTSGADKAAGGLIGSLKGGTIAYSAAAVYVRSDHGVAGGLIGSADSSSNSVNISDSYAGGHTSDGSYLTDLYSSSGGPKAGRINIEAEQDAGGLVGAILGADAEISRCYATTSVASASGEAGAFIGKIVESATLTDNYATFAAVDFVGSDETQDGKDDYEVEEADRATAIYYDAYAARTFENKYPLMTVKQLGATAPETSAIVATRVYERHYGDVEARSDADLEIMLIDAEQLYAKVIDNDYTDRDRTSRTNNGKVTSEGIDASLLKADGSFNLDKAGKGAIVLTYESVEPDAVPGPDGKVAYHTVSGTTSYTRVLYPEINAAKTNPTNSNYETGAFCSSSETADVETYLDKDGKEKTRRTYYVLLDSITTKAPVSGTDAVNGHFASRFPVLKAGALVRVTASKVGYDGSVSDVEGSLFDTVVDGGKRNVYVSNFRHLENLDSTVSGVPSGYVSIATQADFNESDGSATAVNMVWKDADSSFVNRIKNGIQYESTTMNRWPADGSTDGDGEPTVAIYAHAGGSSLAEEDTYYPVSPTSTLEYAGGSKNIRNVVVRTSGPAGLFGVLPAQSKVHDLELLDCAVESTVNFGVPAAGILLGGTTEPRDGLAIKNVLVRDSGRRDGARVKSQGQGASGGLIGMLFGADETIELCAASVRVESSGMNTVSGGLIGYVDGSGCKLINSYVGGHTNEGTYETEPDAINVRTINTLGIADTSVAGGLVGYAKGLSVKDCYSTASVSASFAGGLIGYVTGGSTENSYATGFVGGGAKGSLIGRADETPTLAGNYYFEIVNPAIKPIASLDLQKDQATPFDESAKTFEDFYKGTSAAYPYDATLKSLYQEKYPYRTIDQLSSDSIPNDSFVYGKHYGDWPSPETPVVNEATTNNTNGSGE